MERRAFLALPLAALAKPEPEPLTAALAQDAVYHLSNPRQIFWLKTPQPGPSAVYWSDAAQDLAVMADQIEGGEPLPWLPVED